MLIDKSDTQNIIYKNDNIEYEDIGIEYEIDFRFKFDPISREEEFNIRNFECDLIEVNYDFEKRKIIGRATGTIIGSDASYEIDVCEACDSRTQELYDAYVMVRKSNDELSSRIVKALDRDRFESPSWMHLARMQIDQNYRGNGLGLLVALSAIKLSEVEIVVCKPFPLDRKKGDSVANMNAQIEKLATYWKHLGFVEIGTKNNRWLALDRKYEIPSVTDLVAKGLLHL